MTTTICTNASTNGFYPSEEGVAPDSLTPKVVASGDFWNARFTLEANIDDGDFVAVPGGDLNTGRVFGLNLGEGMKIRFVATNCDANTSVTIKVN